MDPPKDSEREFEFQKNRQYLIDVVKRVIDTRKKKKDGKSIPFIDNLLECGAIDDQVSYGTHT